MMSEAEKVQAGARLKRMPSVEPEIRVISGPEKGKFLDDAIRNALEDKFRIMTGHALRIPEDEES